MPGLSGSEFVLEVSITPGVASATTKAIADLDLFSPSGKAISNLLKLKNTHKNQLRQVFQNVVLDQNLNQPQLAKMNKDN